MPITNGIAITFSRPTDFGREEEWARWYDDEHLPDTVGDETGAWVAGGAPPGVRHQGFEP